MGDSTSTFEWKSHIVLACITCEKVILFTKPDKDQKAARKTSQKFRQLITNEFDPRKFDDEIVNVFLPTVCSSCDGAASWTSLPISRSFMQTWQPYLAMKACLEEDLSMIGSSISLVHREKVTEITSSGYMIQSAVVNPSSGTAAQVQPYLQSGLL